ncbi:MAG: ATP-binding cassette domain-containing protein [Candidatus Heimdallarchaeota archaeon]|nr:ATP-binding cassette domain-containing protein [Candidatus Heimdallarchaeota archaeon]
MTESTYILEGRNLAKSFDNLKLFSGLNIQIYPNEKICLLGLSGSGKTTLMGILSGLRTPDEGTVHIKKINIYKESKFERAKFIGMIFQNFALMEDLSSLENIVIAKWHLDQDTEKITEKIMPILDKVGLTFHINKYPYQLSAGLQQRVALARALVNDPIIIFADEPTANLDTENSKNIMSVLLSVTNENRALLYSTHDLEIAKYADRVYILQEGKLNLINKNRLNESTKLIDLYL